MHSLYAVSPFCLPHPSLPFILRLWCHFIWQVFESPVKENRSKVLFSLIGLSFLSFHLLLFKKLCKAMLNLSTHFSSCHSFRCSLKISATPLWVCLCVYLKAIILVQLSLKDILQKLVKCSLFLLNICIFVASLHLYPYLFTLMWPRFLLITLRWEFNNKTEEKVDDEEI